MAPSFLSFLIYALAVSPVSLAHPGHDLTEEASERAAFVKRSPNSVRTCAPQLARRGQPAAALARRQEMAHKARTKRGLTSPIVRRDFAAYNVSHASTSGASYGDDETSLFSDNSTCILQPEVTVGPYYVDGELIRSDIVAGEEGVPLYLDIQLVDTSTCEPVPAAYIDIWACNSTGVYSGVVASGNGDQNDTTNLDNTALRGIQLTDVNGVAQFETIFPGHYTGRATHIHILTHNTNTTTIRTNGTILGTNGTTHATHIGQIFFDQDLISEVESTAPYSTNTQVLTTNAEDSILGEEAADMDPFVEYVLLGDNVSDGIMAWISIGIDPTADEETSGAATIYSDGGVANANSGMGGMPGNGTSGSGTPPSGTPPSSTAA